MFTLQQLVTMLTMQESMQVAQLGPDWRSLGHNYGRAISVEAHEAMDHVGYKWWKDQAINMDQLRMEAIDMLHFEFCSALEDANDLQDFLSGLIVENVNTGWTDTISGFSKYTLLEKLDELSIGALQGEYTIRSLIHLFRLCNLTGDDVFKLYIGKNVLNRFRKDNGYKDGSYVKDWTLGEDNVHLTRILNELPADLPDFENEVYKALDHDYNIVNA